MKAALHIEPIACLKDNYAYLLFDGTKSFCAVVDPSEEGPVAHAIETRGLTLTHILDTHHHMDHVGGNLALQKRFGARIIGAAKDRARIPGIEHEVSEGDTVTLGAHAARVIEIPGHTTGHIAYWFEHDDAVFTGDTLFAMGCGRLFEGTPEMMWQSLSKLMALPDTTRVYCGHEYTEANGRFALCVEPNNAALQTRMAAVRRVRAEGQPTVPSNMALEKATNPFLRTQSPELKKSIGLQAAGDVAVFAETRRRKDSF